MNVESTPEPVVLIIADISGYTRYMTANAKTLTHSQALITELVKTILAQVELPLKVAKLEGDAVFLFARKGADPSAWIQNRRLVGEKLFRLFEKFGSKVRELSSATTCACDACSHIEKLRLKIVVHSGEALFHRVLEFEELAGVDVIIVHRLLKNSIKADQYLLVTAAAEKDLELPGERKLARGREICEGIGEIGVGVYYPDGDLPVRETERSGTFPERFGKSWSLLLNLWFRPFASKGRGSGGKFNHIVASGSRAGRAAFVVLTGILTPIYLPIGALFVLAHALRGPRPANATAEHEHRHDVDGS